MNNKLKKISLFCFLLPLLANAGTVNKSPADPREYENFTLKNGIEVITVSDPSLATSAATLSVGVGQFQDPKNAQGIAHFLEHMIFMGSEKYKSPNEYMQFISENGGQTNAYTAAQQQSSGSLEARMTLPPIQWVPVQDKGSKILCVKLGAMKVTPSDPLHQEYLTINLGSTSD